MLIFFRFKVLSALFCKNFRLVSLELNKLPYFCNKIPNGYLICIKSFFSTQKPLPLEFLPYFCSNNKYFSKNFFGESHNDWYWLGVLGVKNSKNWVFLRKDILKIRDCVRPGVQWHWKVVFGQSLSKLIFKKMLTFNYTYSILLRFFIFLHKYLLQIEIELEISNEVKRFPFRL